MCGRIGRPDLTWQQIYEMQRGFLDGLDVERVGDARDLGPSWNVKPTSLIDIAYLADDRLQSTPARWWFVPHWHRGSVKDWKQTTFNARIETAHEKPTFRTAWQAQRCIIPALGYYEWLGQKGAKRPFWITTQRNNPVMFFAGLYSRREDGLHTCTILTRPALPQIAHIHARTPVILENHELLDWMRADIPTAQAQDTLGTGWDGRMHAHEVDPFGRDDDGPVLIEPINRLI